MKRLIAVMLASGWIVLGQPVSNAITITASRTVYSQPDQVVFYVDVNSGLDTDLEGAVAALAGTGITTSNFTSVYAQASRAGIFPPLLDWSFTLAVPLAKLKDTIASLTAVQQRITQNNAGLGMTFGLHGTQSSPQPCSTADLLADARTQAQKIANAAGLSVGPVLVISEPGLAGAQTSTPAVYGLVVGAASGFTLGLPALVTWFSSFQAPTANCSLVVEFAMLR